MPLNFRIVCLFYVIHNKTSAAICQSLEGSFFNFPAATVIFLKGAPPNTRLSALVQVITVCIRSARQLYALSLYYPQYADAVKDSVFRQELNIDYSRYEWTNYDVVPAKINTQAPIGTGDKPFTAAAIR